MYLHAFCRPMGCILQCRNVTPRRMV
uniref:Uncharacterized protein n=1 Tax=Rhizophora mucronata TaxID=61149 RepID=A0A2P2QMS2_RHIMU